MVRRIFAEKKPGFDSAARSLLSDLRRHITPGLTNLRIINRYDAEGTFTEDEWRRCVNQLFAEPAADFVYDTLPACEGFTLAVKFLPGQYDQRADSAAQCVQIITGGDTPLMETARIFLCDGVFTESERTALSAYFINPVDSMKASLTLPETLASHIDKPKPVPVLNGFNAMNTETLRSLHTQMGLAMREDDLLFCQRYFQNENREPTLTEIKVIDTYWSDHCRHTTFTTTLDNIVFEDGPHRGLFEKAYKLYQSERKQVYGEKDKPVTLMDIAVMGMKALRRKGLLNDLDESEEINACSIVIPVEVDGQTEEWLLLFKNETHNHPTEIEPFGGAATCLGGAIRDPLSGRAYVYQAMRVTGSGDPTVPLTETWPGKLPQRVITTQAAAGFSSYGNQIGLATGHVAEVYHPGYTAKRMEIGAVMGAVKRSAVRRERPEPGDVILLMGGRTGRDGCGGATGSSRSHTEASLAHCGAEVQKGNPLTERKLQRLFANAEAVALIKRCNDFGAGGVCVAIGELADGVDIDLDTVPKKYEGLDGTELAISESQERMAVVVAPEDAKRLIALAAEENLEATPVAEVTASERIIMRWRGDVIVDIARSFLDSSGAPRSTAVRTASPVMTKETPSSDTARWLSHIAALNNASQKGLVERFDATIGAGTVLMPFNGKHRLTPAQVMAAKIPVPGGKTDTVSVMAYGFDPYASEQSPFHGAVYAVTESLAKLVAAGAPYASARLTCQEYFERLGDDPLRWQKPFLSLLGAFWAQMCFETPSVGGKDSMSGSYEDKHVPPSLVSFAVQTAKTGDIISPELKQAGHSLVWLRAIYDGEGMPDFDYIKESFAQLTRLIHDKKVCAAYALDTGGIASALTKMALGNAIGADIVCEDLYHAEPGSFLLELTVPPEDAFTGLRYTVLGCTVQPPVLTVNGTEISLNDCHDAWLGTLEGVFPTGRLRVYDNSNLHIPLYEAEHKNTHMTIPQIKTATKPRVFLPVFPGSNCEYDTARAFEAAGAEVDMLVVRNLTAAELSDSAREMARRIGMAQLLMLSGGFSAGDEPEGSGKFIAAMFRNPLIADATLALLNNRDGLALGICNGFQALTKVGLLPYGDIREMADDAPTLTFNAIGRHISDLVRTKVVSNKSPWLWHTHAGEMHLIPVSHGEGRFVASDTDMRRMIAKNQVATQYTDFNGEPSMDIRYNPNGSVYAVEGITSPDGRVFGKMGHSERIGAGLYAGFEGNMDQRLFEAGVRYFA